MIHSRDRSYWIGASDASMVMGNWNTETFNKWYLQKLGINKDHFETIAMQTGTHFEHKILDAISPVIEKDAQIIIPELGLRVNYDGIGPNGHIFEVKTHRNPFKVTKAYWRQAQIEILAYNLEYKTTIPKLDIVSYQVTEDDYTNFFNEIDKSRIGLWPIEFDEDFCQDFIEKVKVLHDCIKRGVDPRVEAGKESGVSAP